MNTCIHGHDRATYYRLTERSGRCRECDRLSKLREPREQKRKHQRNYRAKNSCIRCWVDNATYRRFVEAVPRRQLGAVVRRLVRAFVAQQRRAG